MTHDFIDVSMLLIASEIACVYAAVISSFAVEIAWLYDAVSSARISCISTSYSAITFSISALMLLLNLFSSSVIELFNEVIPTLIAAISVEMELYCSSVANVAVAQFFVPCSSLFTNCSSVAIFSSNSLSFACNIAIVAFVCDNLLSSSVFVASSCERSSAFSASFDAPAFSTAFSRASSSSVVLFSIAAISSCSFSAVACRLVI